MTVLLGTYAFAWQIYGDFSGYSDIARGSAQLLGFHFMVNFRQPYLAQSLQDFWRRWHISLSTWLRDYLYIPLGGNRMGSARTYPNLMVTMLLAACVARRQLDVRVWGGIHGGGLAVERVLTARRGDGLRPQRSRSGCAALSCSIWCVWRGCSSASLLLHGAFAQLAGSPLGLAARLWRRAGVPRRVYVALLFLLDLKMESADTEYLFADQSLAGADHDRVALCVLMTLPGPIKPMR